MKYRILAVIVIILMLFSITVNASNYEYTITTGDSFKSARSGDDLTDISEKLNMTPQDLNSYFTKNGLVYIAVSDDGKSQIKISAFTDNFSSEVSDIAYLNDSVMSEFIAAVSNDAATPAQVVVNDGRKFLCLKNTLQDSGGIYTVTQYITICNNKTFYFAAYNDGNDTSQEMIDIFNTFKLKENVTTTTTDTPKVNNKTFSAYATIINCGIIAFAIIAIVCLLGIIKSYSKAQENNQNDD